MWPAASGVTFSFGIFPLGVMNFNTRNWVSAFQYAFTIFRQLTVNGDGRAMSREEQINQYVSLLFLVIGIVVTVWILLKGGTGTEL